MKHVSAYSHSDRWIGASGAWGDAWVGAGEIPWSQGIRNLRCGTVFRNDRAVPGGGRNNAELRKEQATSALDRAANAAKEVGISCKTTQVENGQPHQAIIAAAEDKGCDLIVMSSHGRSGLSMLLIGSVTNKVLTHAKTPVLVCQ